MRAHTVDALVAAAAGNNHGLKVRLAQKSLSKPFECRSRECLRGVGGFLVFLPVSGVFLGRGVWVAGGVGG